MDVDVPGPMCATPLSPTGVIDNEEKVRHSKIAEKTEDTILNPSKINIKLKVWEG